MDKFQIETAQNIQLSQKTANLGDRFVGYLLDLLVLIAYELIMIFIFSSLKIESFFSQWVLVAVFGLPPFLYHLLMETFNNGQSIGKAAMRTRVVNIDGSAPTFSNYLIRWLLRIVDFSLTSGAVAVVTFLLNDNGQRLGDIAAKTTVISEKERMTIDETLIVDIPEDYEPKYPQVTVFTDRDIEKIKNLFRKAKRKHQWQVIDALYEKTIHVMDINPEGENKVDFIERVISDYNYYTQF